MSSKLTPSEDEEAASAATATTTPTTLTPVATVANNLKKFSINQQEETKIKKLLEIIVNENIVDEKAHSEYDDESYDTTSANIIESPSLLSTSYKYASKGNKVKMRDRSQHPTCAIRSKSSDYEDIFHASISPKKRTNYQQLRSQKSHAPSLSVICKFCKFYNFTCSRTTFASLHTGKTKTKHT